MMGLDNQPFIKVIEVYYDKIISLKRMNEKTLEINFEPVKYTEEP